MIARRYRVLLLAGLVFVVSWLLIVIADASPGPSLLEVMRIGCFFGSLFGQTTLAAAWTAFGRAKLIWRVPLALVWLVALAFIAARELVNNGWQPASTVLPWCLVGQWLLLQLPLWGLALVFGYRLRHVEETPLFDPRQLQFGIRQLIIVTAVIAVILGIGRLIAPSLRMPFNIGGGDGTVFVALTLASLVISLPLLFTALLSRKALLMTMLTCVFLGLASMFESLLFDSVGIGPGPETSDFIAINTVTAGTILAFVGVVRLNGCRLTKGNRSGNPFKS